MSSPSGLGLIFGAKPDVPVLPPVDLGKEQGKAISNNLAALPAAEDLTSRANLFSSGQITNMLEAVTPDFMAQVQSINANNLAMEK